MANRLSVAIDTGGTFTDITLMDLENGESWIAKTPSTPDDRSRALADGVAEVLALAGREGADISHVLHGTTVATNMILEDKGAVCGLLTTRGFRHVLEIGRHDIPRHANPYTWIKPRRPVPPERIVEVDERVDPKGTVLTSLDEASVRDAAKILAAEGVEAVAVCLLHAYANPAHERRAAEILAEVLPDVMITISSDVLPVFREYERGMATILNAFVMPGVARYVSRIRERLSGDGIDARLLLMKSSGGVIGADGARETPIQTALSGPAAGVVGAGHVAELAGFERVISLDVGGTSADICLIDGEPVLSVEGRVGEWPMQLPMIDIHTIGSGGGSIAQVTADGELRVGPASAGADPGPVAYGRGGTEPTVTDAHAVLGHLPTDLVGGAMTLDRDLAHRAIEDRIAGPLGINAIEAARGILEVAANDLAGAIRVVSVQRGRDPLDFALLPFGGAGPLQAGRVARLLGIPTIIIPPAPGVLSSLGLIVSPLRNEFSRTVMQRMPSVDMAVIQTTFTELCGQAEQWLITEQVDPGTGEIVRQAGMRYEHQGFELYVDWSEGESLEDAIARFHDAHEQLYTFQQPDTPVEIVTVRVTALGLIQPTTRPRTDFSDTGEAVVGRRSVDFGDGQIEAAIVDRAKLVVGAEISGPAIVTQLDATTLILEGQTAIVHESGSLIVR